MLYLLGSGNHTTDGNYFALILRCDKEPNNFSPFPFLFIQLEVEVTDLSGKIIDGPVRLDISVIDQNDNRPMFKEGPYIGHVMEGSPTGKFVMISINKP